MMYEEGKYCSNSSHVLLFLIYSMLQECSDIDKQKLQQKNFNFLGIQLFIESIELT